jgi:hypothetical protein
MADPTPSTGDGAPGSLGKKLGPLKEWQWAAAAAALALAYLLYRRHAAANAAPSMSAGGSVPDYPTSGDLANAGLYQPPDQISLGTVQGPTGPQGPPGINGANTAQGMPPLGVATRTGGGVMQPGPILAQPVSPAATIAPAAAGQASNTQPAQRYVTVRPWPDALGSLSGIAAAAGISLATIERLNPQYAANWNLIHPGDSVRVA